MNLNSSYRCTRKRIPRSLLTVGTCFSLAPIRRNSCIASFVRRVVSVDYKSGYFVDHYGDRFPLCSRLVYICLPR